MDGRTREGTAGISSGHQEQIQRDSRPRVTTFSPQNKQILTEKKKFHPQKTTNFYKDGKMRISKPTMYLVLDYYLKEGGRKKDIIQYLSEE